MTINFAENCDNVDNTRVECDSDDEYDGSEQLHERIQRILDKSGKIFIASKTQKVNVILFFPIFSGCTH